MPEWARGRTAGEVLSISDQLYRAVANPAAAPPPASQPPLTERPWQQAQPPAPPAAASPPTDDDWLQRPNEAFQRAAQAYGQTQFAPVLQNMAASLAETAREQVRREDEHLWARYGPEIAALIAPVDVTVRKVDTYRMAADIVRGRHFAELAAERQQAKLATLPAAERASGGSASVPVAPLDGFDFEKLSPAQKDRWTRAGITQDTIKEWCVKTGLTPKQFMDWTLDERVVGETLDGAQMVRPEPLKIAAGYRS